MNKDALIKKVNLRLEEFLDTATILGWFDDAQNQMAMMVNADFPQFLNADGTISGLNAPVFDNKYHEALVVYAIARYREMDSSLPEMEYMDKQFNAMMLEFSRRYTVPAQYRDDITSAQFIAKAGDDTFVLPDDNFNPDYMELRVYQNSSLVPFSTTIVDLDSPSMSVDAVLLDSSVTVADGDVITVVWEDAPIDAYKPDNWVGW